MDRKKEKAPKEENIVSRRGVAALIQKNIPSDVLGSYTGFPLKDEKPVQDADDL